MTRHFSLPTVLRMIPNGVLRGVFTRLGHALYEVPWEKLPQYNIAPLLAAIQRLSPTEQNALESVLHDIFDLACENGSRAIREAATLLLSEKPPFLPDVGRPYCLSAWVWLHEPALFDQATRLFEVDQLSRWRKRKDVPRVVPRTSPAALAELATAISRILQQKEGRGQRCTVEFISRKDGAAYFLAYPDDFVQTILLHDKADLLTPRSIRPTFDMVFAYDQAVGTLELNAKVPTPLKVELEEVFCRLILGQAAEHHSGEAVYNLNVLKAGPQRLETDPEDHVTPIVRRLRLAIPESRQTITLEANRAAGPESIYRMLEECLNGEKLPLSDLDVTSATLGFVLHPRDGRKSGRLVFDVARPDTCTLRNHRADCVALAQKYLKRWGIAVG